MAPQEQQKKYHIGYVAGAFDMFHIGHLNLLRRAKERCDYLIAGVMSDERIIELKKRPPIIPCNERMQIVEACRYVDRVEELPVGQAGIMDAYNRFGFDCMFSGDDHANNPGWLSERDRLRERGSDIVFVSYTKETSSTAIREKLEIEKNRVHPGDARLLTDANHRWIYTYDYAPDSVWEEWRTSAGIAAGSAGWIETEAGAVADRVEKACGGRDLPCYLVLADSHFAYNGTWEDTASSMHAIAKRVRLDGILHLGDLTDGLLPLAKTEEIESHVMADMESLGVPVYVVPGNHDYNYFRGNPEIRYPKTPRYVVDDERHRLRLIVIDSFDPKDERRYGFTEETIEWLDETLRDLPAGYKTIVLSHLTPLVRLQAWAKDIRNREKLIAVLDRHAERILAFMNGHNHCDQLFNDLHNGQFPIISLNCAKCECFPDHKPKGAEMPFRMLGDRTQECFDIMQVDAGKGEIYLTRFGAGRDRIVKDHKAFPV
ncbi:MAG: adenylyltransferase/cytidyltransferase family protein [Lachnospiraceae bacterium]|nr:adenylyltransferase/cytidyltransferase family protein [Lachnospiraceae bacterium]